MKRQVFIASVFATVGAISTVSGVMAVESNFSTLQERPTEVIEQHNVIRNFRALQQERLGSQDNDTINNVADEESVITEQSSTETELVDESELTDTATDSPTNTKQAKTLEKNRLR